MNSACVKFWVSVLCTLMLLPQVVQARRTPTKQGWFPTPQVGRTRPSSRMLSTSTSGCGGGALFLMGRFRETRHSSNSCGRLPRKRPSERVHHGSVLRVPYRGRDSPGPPCCRWHQIRCPSGRRGGFEPWVLSGLRGSPRGSHSRPPGLAREPRDRARHH